MKKKLLAVLSLALIAVLAIGLAACTGDKDDPTTTAGTTAAPKKVLTVGFDPTFPPMGFEENGKEVGFDLELAAEVAKRLGYEFKTYQVTDWKALQTSMDAGLFNCVWNGFTRNSERVAAFEMTEAYMKNNMVVVVKADSAVQKLADLDGKQLAIQSGSSAEDDIKAYEFTVDGKTKKFADSIKLVGKDNNLVALQEVEAGAVAGAVIDRIVAEYQMTKNDGKYRLLEDNLTAEEYAVGFKKGDTATRDAVQAELDKMIADGTFKTISEKWFGKDVSIK